MSADDDELHEWLEPSEAVRLRAEVERLQAALKAKCDTDMIMAEAVAKRDKENARLRAALDQIAQMDCDDPKCCAIQTAYEALK